MQVEPQLQPMSGETLSHRTSNTNEHARLDISAKGFWNSSHEQAFFDVRVFNPLAKSHFNQSLSSCYRKNENEKKRAYEERIRNVEHGTFTPFVFLWLVVWVQSHQLFINVWLPCSQLRLNNLRLRIKLFVGFIAV